MSKLLPLLAVTCLLLAQSMVLSTVVNLSTTTSPSTIAKSSPVNVHFSTNVTKIEIGRFFLATCNISNFADVQTRSYLVNFMENAQVLATYEITGMDNKHILENKL